MRIIIGKNPTTDFKILADDGQDLTDHLHVSALVLNCTAERGCSALLRLAPGSVEVDMDVIREHATVVPAEDLKITTEDDSSLWRWFLGIVGLSKPKHISSAPARQSPEQHEP